MTTRINSKVVNRNESADPMIRLKGSFIIPLIYTVTNLMNNDND